MNKYKVGDIVWITPNDATPREAIIIGITYDGNPQIQCVNDSGVEIMRTFPPTRVCFYNDKLEL